MLELFIDVCSYGEQREIGAILNRMLTQATAASEQIQKLLDFVFVSMNNVTFDVSEKAESDVPFTFILSAFSTVISLILAIIFGVAFSKRIVNLSNSAEKIADGDLDISIATNSVDELGILSRNIARVADTVRHITDDISKMGADHQAGQISTTLDASFL